MSQSSAPPTFAARHPPCAHRGAGGDPRAARGLNETARYPTAQGGDSHLAIGTSGPGPFQLSGRSGVTPASPAAGFTITPPAVGRYTVTGTFDGDEVNLPSTATAATLTACFRDYAPGGTFFDDALWLVDRGIVLGDGVDFRPAAAVTRQAMAAFLHRLVSD